MQVCAANYEMQQIGEEFAAHTALLKGSYTMRLGVADEGLCRVGWSARGTALADSVNVKKRVFPERIIYLYDSY